MKIEFEGKNEKELMAAAAAWLAMMLAKKKNEPDVEPQGGDGGGPG